MQIKIRGEMTIADVRQALFEKLNDVEEDLAIRYSKGATLYLHPTNGFGDEVVPRNHSGRRVDKVFSDGPYRSAADEFKL
ncbi:hypothetical protein [Marinobacterium sedimentorum]|uniref:hypothetical protein n=1 Tax=Marinobacterium sedimentorum TaxID=2927804 RepID=UPI0020C72371|nr:hypothetical protein [Marinobacterium sedimentorum]MCP8685969.1 hypothetical protein [Marinobacterium sedimentorum]